MTLIALLVVGAIDAIIVGAITADAGAIVGAIVGGVFMLVNSILTVWLTQRIDREQGSSKIYDSASSDSDSTGANRRRRYRGADRERT